MDKDWKTFFIGVNGSNLELESKATHLLSRFKEIVEKDEKFEDAIFE